MHRPLRTARARAIALPRPPVLTAAGLAAAVAALAAVLALLAR